MSNSYIDQDYLNKLSHKELEFLSDFNEEFIRGNFNHGGRNIHRVEQRRECYGRNNSINRDIYARADAAGKLDYKEEKDYERQSSNPEDVIIEFLDNVHLSEKNKNAT